MARRKRKAGSPHPDILARQKAEESIREALENAITNARTLIADATELLKMSDLGELHAELPDLESLAEDIHTDIKDALAQEFPDAPSEGSLL